MTRDVRSGPGPRIVAAAAALYRGGFARRFAAGKLTHDPLFGTLLRTAAIPDAACLVDLGCGQGLLAAWLYTARAAWAAGGVADEGRTDWPTAWQPPPKISTYLGIDRSARDIQRARRALPPFARVFRGDLRTLGATLLDRCDVVTLFDVLHYLDRAGQEALISAIAAGLPPWGVLVVRIGDGGATRRGDPSGLFSHVVDLVVAASRGFPRLRLHPRSLAEWTTLLATHGFRVETLDDPRRPGDRTFANVLLRASRPAAEPAVTPVALR